MSKLSTSIHCLDDLPIDVASLTTGHSEPFITVTFGERDAQRTTLFINRRVAEVLSDKLAVALALPIRNPMQEFRDGEASE